MVALQSYMEIHHIAELIRNMSTANTEGTVRKPPKTQKPKLTLIDGHKARKSTSPLIAKYLKNAQKDEMYDFNVLHPDGVKLHDCIGIYVDTEMQVRYREDIKLYEIIEEDKRQIVKRLLHWTNLF